MADTAIEWATKVWNPTTGCDRVSPGCDHCYAMTMAKRLKGMGSAKYQRDGDPKTSGPGFGLSVHPDTLDLPLRWRKPQRIFVNSMSDLFHDQVPDEYIAQVWSVMAMSPRHTFQVLTKRHARMRSLLSRSDFRELMADNMHPNEPNPDSMNDHLRWRIQWPLPNVWLGVSAENQQWADIRIPALLETPAAVRFISAEPLLGPIDLGIEECDHHLRSHDEVGCWLALDWVIVGGESGPGARIMVPDYAREIRDQCTAAGVAFLFKQWGEWAPFNDRDTMQRVGKKAAGRELDGRTWDEYPAAVHANA